MPRARLWPSASNCLENATPRAAPSFSAQLGAMAGAQAVMREAQAAAAREGAAAQPVKVARAQPVRA
ncbi:MAG: hypothetical protein EOP93_17915 [Lysobacteraceae bacterium]|nr:MAG: hypothetical protein EOP93_17915 [Xanthomonadaceae bacterium]